MAYVALSFPGSLHFKVSLPAIGRQQCIEMQFQKFSKNPDISGFFLCEIVKTIFQCIIILQLQGEGPK